MQNLSRINFGDYGFPGALFYLFTPCSSSSFLMAKHHPDLIFCRKQPGVGRSVWYYFQVIAFCSHWQTLRKMWWEVCYMRFICSSVHTSPHMWWVQLWFSPGPLRNLRGTRCIGRLLLSTVHLYGERRKLLSRLDQFLTFWFSGTAVRRSWTLGALRRTCSTKGKNMDSNSDDNSSFFHFFVLLTQNH